MFWLPVKGPVYWKHTSFPMFSFLSLFSPLFFFFFVFPTVYCLGCQDDSRANALSCLGVREGVVAGLWDPPRVSVATSA